MYYRTLSSRTPPVCPTIQNFMGSTFSFLPCSDLRQTEPKLIFALWREQGIAPGARAVTIMKVPNDKKPPLERFGIRHQIPSGGAVQIFFFLQKAAEQPLGHIQLFCSCHGCWCCRPAQQKHRSSRLWASRGAGLFQAVRSFPFPAQAPPQSDRGPQGPVRSAGRESRRDNRHADGSPEAPHRTPSVQTPLPRGACCGRSAGTTSPSGMSFASCSPPAVGSR